MDKIYKAGQWAWRNKERMILLALVIVLCYRVFLVVNHTPATYPPIPPAPRNVAPEGEAIPQPPPPPVMQPSKDYSSLHKQNPFWVYSSTGEAKDGGGDSAASTDANVKLLDIRKIREGYSARIKTQTTKWYEEGDKFDGYRLTKIDPDNRSVEVYSESQGKTLTLRIE